MTELVLTFPDIDPVAINLFGLKIHWYAIMYLLAFGVGYLLMRRRLHHEPYRSITEPKPWGAGDIEDLLLNAMVGVIVGGRLGYCLFYQPAQYLADPVGIIRVWDGGMSFHGGAIGVILGIAWFARRAQRPFLQVADFLVPVVPIGLAFGRLGNFINGELWGREASADLPWAMIFPTGGDVPRHPSQLYQALLEGLLLFVLLWCYARKPHYRGQVAGAFLFGYGVFRFVAEFWREPDAHLGLLGLGLSMGQWLSVPMILAGALMWGYAQRAKVSDVETVDKAVDNPGEEPVENPEPAENADPQGDPAHPEPAGVPSDFDAETSPEEPSQTADDKD